MRKTFWEWFVDKFDNFVEKIGCLRSCLQKTVIKNKNLIIEKRQIALQTIVYYSILFFFQRLRDNREKFSKLRIIYLNNKKPASYHGDEPLQYKNNRIKTSKVLSIQKHQISNKTFIKHQNFFFDFLVYSVQLFAKKLMGTVSTSCQFLLFN